MSLISSWVEHHLNAIVNSFFSRAISIHVRAQFRGFQKLLDQLRIARSCLCCDNSIFNNVTVHDLRLHNCSCCSLFDSRRRLFDDCRCGSGWRNWRLFHGQQWLLCANRCFNSRNCRWLDLKKNTWDFIFGWSSSNYVFHNRLGRSSTRHRTRRFCVNSSYWSV